ncbi:molecular chaperone DnaJ [Dietzia sp. E1]|uniref:molecular chaperone DnaJ n=1 Tax=Dietzia sp. E1 TaxID=328361 RepID=UPI0015F80D09|nr:molecular chaperone DnaJ [Dietzia sp. E1]
MSQREWVEKDYYAELGVSKTASQDDIRKAYRKLARENHPDSNPGNAAAEDKFKRISEANDVIGDPAKRKEYDAFRAQVSSGGFSGFTPGGGGYTTTSDFDLNDLFGGGGPGGAGGFSDLFGGLFNQARGGGGAGGRSRAQRPRGGQDVETALTLSFREAALGETVQIKLSSPSPCLTCHGSGARPGTSPKVCGTCHGAGVTQRNQGAFGFAEPCTDCGGTGSKIDDPCPECSGSGVTNRTRTINVKVPAGVQDGQRIRLSGQGEAGFRGAPSGDLYVTVTVQKDAVFDRDGSDLLVDLPVSYPELVRGAQVSVPTLTGRVTVKIPAGSRDGQILRVRGRGIASKTGTGDLKVTLRVATPPAGMAEAELAAYDDALRAAGFDPRSGWAGAT